MSVVYFSIIDDILKNKVDKKAHLIPRKVEINEHLIPMHRYIDLYNNKIFKVLSVFSNEDGEYYETRYPKSRISIVPFPVKDVIELKPDKKNLIRRDIINDGKWYYGYEIKYWFYIRRYDINSEKYRTFVKFLDKCSKSVIQDNKLYKIKANYNKQRNIYIKGRLIRNNKT